MGVVHVQLAHGEVLFHPLDELRAEVEIAGVLRVREVEDRVAAVRAHETDRVTVHHHRLRGAVDNRHHHG